MDSTELFLLLAIVAILGAALGAFAIWWSSRSARQKANDIALDRQRLAVQLENIGVSARESARELERVAKENESLKTNLIQQRSINASLTERIEREKEIMTRSQSEMKKDFELLSNKILEEKSKTFAAQNKDSLEAMLHPFREKINVFQKKVEDTQKDNIKDRAQLFERIKVLTDTNQKLSEDAKNLATALKGDNKTQGNWGEMILEKVLESSNLRKGEEYFEQYSMTSDDGKRIQPDFVVNLPDDKHVIIDSKVSLLSYEKFMSEADEESRMVHLRQHMISVKNHIRLLSEKNYQGAKQVRSPDFVLMFMPIEASFALAVKEDSELFSFAWDRKIVIVSPSTLLATLRTIASLWKQDRQNRNTEAIASHASSLYDKFVGFTDDLQKIELNLNKAMGAYHNSMKKLSTGQGNLVRQAERLREMGVKGKKKLNVDGIQKSVEDSKISAQLDINSEPKQ